MPTIEIDESLAKLRIALLEEEVGEFVDAVTDLDLVAIADALADVVYVAYGTAVTYGIDLDMVLSEVHRSNMSKLDKRGQPLIREDGKVIKSDQYFPPDITAVLKRQPPLPLTKIDDADGSCSVETSTTRRLRWSHRKSNLYPSSGGTNVG